VTDNEVLDSGSEPAVPAGPFGSFEAGCGGVEAAEEIGDTFGSGIRNYQPTAGRWLWWCWHFSLDESHHLLRSAGREDRRGTVEALGVEVAEKGVNRRRVLACGADHALAAPPQCAEVLPTAGDHLSVVVHSSIFALPVLGRVCRRAVHTGVVVGVVFGPCSAREAPACDLIGAMIGELGRLYGDIDRVAATSETDFEPPGGIYVVGWEQEVAIVGGGLRRLDDLTGEIRRMYVMPRRRGEGLGRLLLAALETQAGHLGYRRTRLSTGPRQPDAIRLYESHGYCPIADYNNYPHKSFWGEKVLITGRSPLVSAANIERLLY
jgi:GNAT superfamily N-acetyltransferase